MKIDFVAPPFSGHLYPALQLARGLNAGDKHAIRIFSTSSARSAVEDSALEFREILPGRDQDVWAIANTPQKVGSNPLRMWQQVRNNLALMSELQQQMRQRWESDPPELAIVDFVVPVAGLLATEMGIHWWTGMPSPCALETDEATPSYLGGWQPRDDIWGTLRDWSGRKLVRTFKYSTRLVFAKQLREFGIQSLYRTDQTEIIYSAEKILGYGMAELEFPKNWPNCFEFIGPLPLPPPNQKHKPPTFLDGRKTILVSLGTHLHWARSEFEKTIRKVAELLPDIDFHFTAGDPIEQEKVCDDNFSLYRFIPYSEVLNSYAAVIHHAGTGIMYACLQAGLPSLIAPQDYDQFDHAARLIHHRLAKRLPNTAEDIAAGLVALLDDEDTMRSVKKFQGFAESYEPVVSTLKLISEIDH